MMLHEAACVGRRSIGAMQVMLEHTEHGRLLTTVVSGMRNSPHHNPRPGAFHIKKLNFFLPPLLILVAQLTESS